MRDEFLKNLEERLKEENVDNIEDIITKYEIVITQKRRTGCPLRK